MAETTQIQASNSDSRSYGWQRSQDSIERVIWQAIENGEPWPTQLELEMATGLSRSTIQAHVKGLTLETLREHTRALGRKVLRAQAERAIKTGDHNEAKTYFKLNYDWAEKTETRLTGNLNVSVAGKRLGDYSDEEWPDVERGLAEGRILLQGGMAIPNPQFKEIREPEPAENGEIET